MSGELEHGARIGAAHNRAAVQAAGAEMFAGQRFSATGVRDIARHAGVDPALVIRYIGSNDKLFSRTMTMSDAFVEVGERPPRLDGGDAESRAHLLAAQLAGLMTPVYVVESPWLLEAPIDDIVERYGEALRALV